MEDDCSSGGSVCRLSNAAASQDNPTPGGWGPLPFPIPQRPPEHQTATTLARSSTVSRISSALPRSSGGISTSAASLRTLQSPPAAAPSSHSVLNTLSVPDITFPAINVFPSSTRLSTATLISVSSKLSNSVPNIIISPKSSSTTALVASLPKTSNLSTLTLSISASSFQAGSELSSTLSNALLPTSSGMASRTSASVQAAAQQTQAIGLMAAEPAKPGKMDMVVGIVFGIIVGVVLLILPITFCIYRRRTRKQAHRRSIGGIEKDRMFRPWKKSEMNLRRRTANMSSLYYPSEKGSGDLVMPQPAFAPLRPNRSSSLYSGSMLHGLEHLSPQEGISKSRLPDADKDSFSRESVQSLPLPGTRSSSRYSGYVYSDDPFEAPLIAPEMKRPDSVATVWSPPVGYKGRIKYGMGVQRTITRKTGYLKDNNDTF